MTTGVVQFDAASFLGRYPEFTSLNSSNPAALTACFAEAALYLDNSSNSRVQQTEQRQPLLYMLTAHIAFLYFPINGAAVANQVVGRVNSATEGSVSVQLDMGQVTFNAAWFLQTKYGASFWQASAKWRQMRFVPGYSSNPPNVSPPWGGGWGGFGSCG